MFTTLFLSLVGLTVGARLWLNQRQINHIKANRNAVPKAFSDKISLKEHHLAADYSCAKLRVGRFSMSFETIWLLLWTIGGGVNLIDLWWAEIEMPLLLRGVAVILSFSLIAAMLDLPISLYNTFVVEARFGFNKTSLKIWLLDLVKTSLLMIIIGMPILASILWLMNQAGNHWWIYAWALWMTFSLIMIWAYPSLIAPLFNQFSPLPDAPLRKRIDGLLERCGFHSKGVYVVDGSKRSSHGNAYFTGFGKNKRIVFYDTLLETLNEDEVEAVLAHELGHFKRHHIKKSLFMSSLLTLAGFAILAWLMDSDWFYSSLHVETASTHAALLLFLLVMPIFTYFVSPVFSSISRKHEFEADQFACANSDYKALISALVNLYRDNASTLTPDPIHSMFYDSHPPASIRINQLAVFAGKDAG